MAFFEELSKKITETGQGVVQKTKDTAEVMKLNNTISDEEKQINSFYTRIGKHYFESHINISDPVLQNLVSEIERSKNKIAVLSEQVKKLKGIVSCPNCGGDVPYGAPFCSSCGTKMVPQQGQSGDGNTRHCVSCGFPLGNGSAFCTHCGTRAADIPQQQAQPRLCPNCKTEIEEDSAFCINCGMRL